MAKYWAEVNSANEVIETYFKMMLLQQKKQLLLNL
jgi:hypothetical protein